MRLKQLFVIIPVMLSIAGCSAMWGGNAGFRNGTSSSLVDYLYPDGEIPPDAQSRIPELKLPLRVGIAFVPGQSYHDPISEATKMALLETVKAEFLDRDYIAHIEVIPDAYLRSSSGIRGMQQVARLYGVDVMALVSYDQVIVNEDNAASLLYWTIVGAYVIKATSNEVQTFVDTAVFDVPSARLLFRAPGANTTADRSTLVESDAATRKARDAGFDAAIAAMTGNLLVELDKFEERLKSEPQLARTEWKEGHGGGAFGVLFSAVLLLLVASRKRRPGYSALSL